MADTARLAAALGDRYRIERELGAGGMATVYLARDLKHDRDVAVKVLRPELGVVLGAERFLAEIKITARLDHPHILTLIDSGSAEGLLYYVLPLVRGESLRARVDRDHQMGIDDALTIVKQVGSALDYAHRHGVVHRDIKPENILIQEGEAMLADFGIALAVKEAGGNRLTESGLSLGTPQYMSPEQATGERQLDARSDVYSLAAVFYEMIAGEPPVTGATAQAMIAKLLTERPTPLQVVRDTVPPAASAAVAKALAKTPADRFPSAGEFVRTLEAGFGARLEGRRLTRGAMISIGAAVLVLGAAGVVFSLRGGPRARVHLGDKTQLTTSAEVNSPAISGDGKQLAYAVQHCKGADCRYSVVVQDVGGTVTRTVLEGATAAYGIQWSPDRRNLVFNGSIARRFGTYILSTLGGPPREIGPRGVAFFGGGDSLLVGPLFQQDTVFWIHVTTLDGAVHDSIRVPGRGPFLGQFFPVPGNRFVVAQLQQGSHALWLILDRHGAVVDSIVNSCNCGGVADSGSVWLRRLNLEGTGESIIRIGIDRVTGKLSSQQDTIFSGRFTGFSVTDDGASLVMDQGAYEISVWALPFADAIAGHFTDDRRVDRSSIEVQAGISPDGARIGIDRLLPGTSGALEHRLSTRAYAGGAETPVPVSGQMLDWFWSDSTTIAVSRQIRGGQHLALLDVRTGAESRGYDIPDSAASTFDLTAGGWAWVPPPGDRILVQAGAGTKSYPKAPWFGAVLQIAPDSSRGQLAYAGWRDRAVDSIGVHVLRLSDGADVPWGSFLTEFAYVQWVSDGSLLVYSLEGEEQVHLYRIRSPGKIQSLGMIPRRVVTATASMDLKRATVETRDRHADAWLIRVVRP